MEHTNVILSILICSLEERFHSFSRLYEKLQKQSEPYKELIEIRFQKDNGEMSTGEKRNLLLSRAEGKYICFVDDDDDISDDYISSIIQALEENSDCDCVGIQGLLMSSKGSFLFEHSIEHQGWYTTFNPNSPNDPMFIRTPNHLNPVKKSIAEQIGFSLKNFGEDGDYSMGIKRYLKTEVFIEHPIYFYIKEID